MAKRVTRQMTLQRRLKNHEKPSLAGGSRLLPHPRWVRQVVGWSQAASAFEFATERIQSEETSQGV